MLTCRLPPCVQVLVLDLLGPSLYDLLVRCGGRLSLKSVLLLLDQLFHSIEFVHERGFVHRDISPNNLLMGRPGSDDEHRLFLVDFGLSKQFCSGPRFMPAGRRHIRYRQPVVGTMRFASRHAHAGEEVSPPSFSAVLFCSTNEMSRVINWVHWFHFCLNLFGQNSGKFLVPKNTLLL